MPKPTGNEISSRFASNTYVLKSMYPYTDDIVHHGDFSWGLVKGIKKESPKLFCLD